MKAKVQTITLLVAKRLFLAMLVPLLFISCATKEDKSKCRLVETGAVSEVFSIMETYTDVGGDAYGTTHHFLVVNGDTLEYDGVTYPCSEKLEAGDSVWIFKNWNDKIFVSSASGTEAAINTYEGPKVFCFWRNVVGTLLFILILIVGFFLWLWLLFILDELLDSKKAFWIGIPGGVLIFGMMIWIGRLTLNLLGNLC